MAQVVPKYTYKTVEVVQTQTVREISYVLTLSEEEAEAVRIAISDLFVRGTGKEVFLLADVRRALIDQGVNFPMEAAARVSGSLLFSAEED